MLGGALASLRAALSLAVLDDDAAVIRVGLVSQRLSLAARSGLRSSSGLVVCRFVARAADQSPRSTRAVRTCRAVNRLVAVAGHVRIVCQLAANITQ